MHMHIQIAARSVSGEGQPVYAIFESLLNHSTVFTLRMMPEARYVYTHVYMYQCVQQRLTGIFDPELILHFLTLHHSFAIISSFPNVKNIFLFPSESLLSHSTVFTLRMMPGVRNVHIPHTRNTHKCIHIHLHIV
jgi:hypothetical protein